MTSLAAHITFYYNEPRIGNLNKVIDALIACKQIDKKDIWIHTNVSFDLGRNDVNLIVHDCSALMSPRHLTWLHRPLLKSQVGNYSYYMYLGDDLLMPQEAFDYWFEYNQLITSSGYELGFLRIETDNDGNEYVVDILHGERHSGRVVVNGLECVVLKRNFMGFWILGNDDMQKFAQRKDFCMIPNFIEHSIELSERGPQDEYKTTTIVPTRNGRLDNRCKVYHVTNNYWCNKNSGHAKVLFGDCT